MVKAVKIETALATQAPFEGRRPDTPEEELDATFATLARTRESGVFAGSFSGRSAWERHPNGDELVQVLAGFATVTVIDEAGRHELAMGAGTVTMVPRGCWHRFDAPDGVTVMTATPQPTELYRGEDPREA